MFKFIHLTDTHLVAPGGKLHGLDPHARLKTCVAHIAAHHPDAALAIVTGDVADAGEPPAYEAVRAALGALPMPVHLVPGNHDDRASMRAAFPEIPLDSSGFAQQTIETPAGSFILLDTLEPFQDAGTFCERRAEWLAARLVESDDQPVYLFMHHPPFSIGLPALDAIGLADPGPFTEAIAGFDRIRHLFFGHVHRPISGQWRGIPFSTLYGTSHQTKLDLDARDEYIVYTAEPPAYAVVLLDDEHVIVHHCLFLENASDIKDT